MSCCTFSGHRDAPDSVLPKLRNVIYELILYKNADTFLVGNSGNFDRMVQCVLRSIAADCASIHYSVVLPMLPAICTGCSVATETVFPHELEGVPKRYSIDRRNRWMLGKSDYVVTYVEHGFGGAAKYKALAVKQRKNVIELAIDD